MENIQNPETIRVKIGTYMLLWFTNPDNNPNSDGKVERGICSQFFTSLEEAESLANLLSGSKILLMCTLQNPSPDSNIYWDLVKLYGDSFQLNNLTVLPNEFQKAFIKIGKDGYAKHEIG